MYIITKGSYDSYVWFILSSILWDVLKMIQVFEVIGWDEG
jgi:hypothetical protein